MRSEGRRFAERHPVVRQNVHLLIPSVTASPCHRLAAARSRRGSDSLPGCHSTPRRRFATLVTKGRLWCGRNASQLNVQPLPSSVRSVDSYPYPLCPFGAFPPDRGNRPPEGKPWTSANPPHSRKILHRFYTKLTLHLTSVLYTLTRQKLWRDQEEYGFF